MEYDTHLLPPSQTVVVRAYTDDTDDQILAELQPRFIVMFEPNFYFVRRIEVSLSSGYGCREVSGYFCKKKNSVHLFTVSDADETISRAETR
jgi:hypothetical protein